MKKSHVSLIGIWLFILTLVFVAASGFEQAVADTESDRCGCYYYCGLYPCVDPKDPPPCPNFPGTWMGSGCQFDILCGTCNL